MLGSGLGVVADHVEIQSILGFECFPDIPSSKVPGHAGRFLLGKLAGRRVMLSQGRVHLYEGRNAQEVTAGIRLMHRVGVRRVLLTNAAGSINPQFPPGTWMMLNDHLNLTGTSPLIGSPAFVDLSEVYSSQLRGRFMRAATASSIPLHEGVYAGLVGPQYETPAEVRMIARLGADAVGMSTVLEAIQARALEMEVAAFSCLSNWAAGISPEPLSHADVLAVSANGADSFLTLLQTALSDTL